MSQTRNPFIRPYLKWAGGKRQLESEILPLCPKSFKTYYEPFVGAGAILFALQPKKAVINDLNEQLCMTYRAIKDDVESLIELLEEHKSKNSSEYFYKLREYDRAPEFKKLSEVEKAARLIYLNKTCYNGLYRVNSQGFFNTPYGKYKNPSIYDEEVLRAISKYFNNNTIDIRTGGFDSAVQSAKKGDFVYFDPPYDTPDSTNFTGYQAEGFGKDQQIKLLRIMEELTYKGVNCLMSNSATEFIIEQFQKSECDFHIHIVKASRMISSNVDTRAKVDEVLISNYSIE